ncbi:MAG: aromatic ring-hydroxylating dioxygenase subunit alpha [Immundisolibacterales bacterium]|nr:aromatic ring-hydroxylating dioxygenase subunit alpha [Immundisolibacterales bacterium]
MTVGLAISELVAAVDRPVGDAAGLPNRAYTGTEFFRLELERIFAPSWACLGHAADVPRAGDVRPARLLGVPLFMLRAPGGRVRVFHNVCSHRGNELVWEPGRVKGAIRCPYHAWTYDLDGRLTGTPNLGGIGVHRVQGFDCGARDLREVRCARWLDLVFVNLSGDAMPFEDWIAPLATRFEGLGGTGFEDRLHPAATHGEFSFDVRANWKLAVENNLDASHLPWIHPSLNRQSPLEDHYCFLDQDGFAGQGSSAYDTVPHESAPLPRVEAWPARTGEYPCLYPNVFVSGHADHFWTMVLEPVAPDRTIERWRNYFFDGAARDAGFESARSRIRERWAAILGEDVTVVEGMQRGRSSPAFGGGVFAPVLDRPVHHFHRWVARRLAAGEPPARAANAG